MSLLPRPEIRDLPAGVHGGINEAELKAAGIDVASALDFSVCTNPFMPPPGIKRILGKADISRYPDSEAAALRERLSQQTGLPADSIIIGNGTTELIRLIALAYFRPRDPVVIVGPTYGEYETACRIAGAQIIEVTAREEDDFLPPTEELSGPISRHHPRAIFLCNPNNPTGKSLSESAVTAIVAGLGDSLLVLDEAYASFVERRWRSDQLVSRSNVVILRSMTKDWGLAGLRLGYAVARPEIIGTLRRVCPPWNVNAVAQAAGLAVLKRADYLAETMRRTAKVSQYLTKALSRLGLQIVPSDANFFLVKVGNAASFRAALLKRGILVRDCTSFGLPEYVRIGVRTLPECRRLVAVIESLRKEGNTRF